MNYGVGIDLGTTRCCVATQDNNGHIKIVPNDMGKLISNYKCGKRPYDGFREDFVFFATLRTLLGVK